MGGIGTGYFGFTGRRALPRERGVSTDRRRQKHLRKIQKAARRANRR
jgi:hypothetical protein